jgi:aminoglycoside phosphotransferase family enzyme/predicted kinase
VSGEGAPAAAVAETHISVVTMIGDRAYKVLKPVALGFLDHRRREDRARACRRETEVNRRFAPDVYLGVLDVVDEDGALVDHIIAMRRMPAERRLSALLDHEDAADLVVGVARRIAEVHREAPTSAEIAAAGDPEAVRALWQEGVAQARAHAPGVLSDGELDRMLELAVAYLEGRRALLARRAGEGWVRDGHGDLLADDVYCLPDGPRLLDCLAFDDRLRHGDVLLDVAFLAMDLEARGHPGLAAALVREWSRCLGEEHPRSLEHHYVAYRAHVRSKVRALRAAQGDDAAGDEARRLQALALAHLEAGRVRLVLVGGAPGTGKSTVAEAVAARLGWSLERSDALRKDLAGLPPAPAPPSPFREGMYAPAMTDLVYAALLERASPRLAEGESVVLDASWLDRARRTEARRTAERHRADLVEIECAAPREVAAERIRARRAAGAGPSDATPELARAIVARADPWPEARRLATDRSLEETVREALDAIGPA